MPPGDEDVADTFGYLAAASMRRGRPRPMNDAWVAACCLTHRLPLAILNVKDFEDFGCTITWRSSPRRRDRPLRGGA
ncbi:hypothetical protein SAMN05421748_110164 [Paractinoplanes atraurantiacus]|uniref:PIN domain-containing protein n=2 Tax=Paractinoplanes atraurantiacus TaxID=1036182 RepID=A0A285IPH1_9ACTN|nr:hypothetical protein SAMN05421748_110164 [Actinoplanes atraurantiacus]